MRQHHGLTRRRANPCIEADRLEVAHQPFGRLPTLGRVGRVGRDRRNADQFEKPRYRCIKTGIKPVEHLVHLHHDLFLGSPWSHDRVFDCSNQFPAFLQAIADLSTRRQAGGNRRNDGRKENVPEGETGLPRPFGG
jgi:hypothetical protein